MRLMDNVRTEASVSLSLSLFKILSIYLTEKDTATEGAQAGGVGEGEAGFPQSREPDVGLDPRTLGS